jgi:hypothetical protein
MPISRLKLCGKYVVDRNDAHRMGVSEIGFASVLDVISDPNSRIND